MRHLAIIVDKRHGRLSAPLGMRERAYEYRHQTTYGDLVQTQRDHPWVAIEPITADDDRRNSFGDYEYILGHLCHALDGRSLRIANAISLLRLSR